MRRPLRVKQIMATVTFQFLFLPCFADSKPVPPSPKLPGQEKEVDKQDEKLLESSKTSEYSLFDFLGEMIETEEGLVDPLHLQNSDEFIVDPSQFQPEKVQ